MLASARIGDTVAVTWRSEFRGRKYLDDDDGNCDMVMDDNDVMGFGDWSSQNCVCPLFGRNTMRAAKTFVRVPSSTHSKTNDTIPSHQIC